MANNSNLPAKFITVEGVEGVGKSTNIDVVRAALEKNNISYILTREPGGTLLAEQVRDLLLKHHEEDINDLTELLLIFAARSQHLSQVILPALEKGAWVVCDRFTDATYAYQGGGRGIDMAAISSLENLIQGSLRPDLTLLLDLEPQIGLSRAANRGELDRFEQQKLAFFDRVRMVYLQRASDEPERFKTIDAGKPLDEVKAQVLAVMENFCGR